MRIIIDDRIHGVKWAWSEGTHDGAKIRPNEAFEVKAPGPFEIRIAGWHSVVTGVADDSPEQRFHIFATGPDWDSPHAFTWSLRKNTKS